VRIKGYNVSGMRPGSAIGLFAQNTDRKNDFIAGAGAGGIRTSGCDFNPNLCNLDYYPTPGFHSGYIGTGGASSISAFYNSLHQGLYFSSYLSNHNKGWYSGA
jgi:hypothetical protein